MMRDSFVFYRSFADAINDLDDKDRLAAYDAIVRYALDGEDKLQKGAAKAILTMARPMIDINNARYENGRKGGRPKTEEKPNDNQVVTTAEPSGNHIMLNESESDKRKDPLTGVEKKSSRFSPPTPDEVRAYAEEKGLSVDADRFVDFYSSKGWMVGKTQMKDWKAAVRNWARQDRTDRERVVSGQPAKQQPKPNRFHNFDGRSEDLDTDMYRRMRERYSAWKESAG